MKSIKTFSIIFLSFLIGHVTSLKQVTIRCWPSQLIENISNGQIYSATAELRCLIVGEFYVNEVLEVTKMRGLYREYDNLLIDLSFDITYSFLPEEMPKGIGRTIAKSHGHRVKSLSISDQVDLEKVGGESFANMPELEKLTILNNSKIHEISADTFSDLTSLVVLKLDRNNLKNLHVDLLKNLRFLEDFSASKNPIEILGEQLFRNNKKLTSINFDNCNIKRINVDFRKLPNILNIRIKSDEKCQIFKDKTKDVEEVQRNVEGLCKN